MCSYIMHFPILTELQRNGSLSADTPCLSRQEHCILLLSMAMKGGGAPLLGVVVVIGSSDLRALPGLQRALRSGRRRGCRWGLSGAPGATGGSRRRRLLQAARRDIRTFFRGFFFEFLLFLALECSKWLMHMEVEDHWYRHCSAGCPFQVLQEKLSCNP